MPSKKSYTYEEYLKEFAPKLYRKQLRETRNPKNWRKVLERLLREKHDET
jgi:hypothetical protein